MPIASIPMLTQSNVSSGMTYQHSHQQSNVHALTLTEEGVRLLDQTALPGEVRYELIRTASEMALAIERMLVRGAPAIGLAAAYGVVLSARKHLHETNMGSRQKVAIEAVQADIRRLAGTRPTAVNLFWALNEMERELLSDTKNEGKDLMERLTQKALALHQADLEACQSIGNFGATLIPEGAGILTHCNAGALATGGYGTALGVIRSAFRNDPSINVFVDETRPRLQGARLTTWELQADGIPNTLITDSMSGTLMRAGKVQVVVVGADRIAVNGDTANKIGTYNLALIAKAHGVPFYVAAPLSTIDWALTSGQDIPIEERDSDEIAQLGGERLCAEGVQFYNPAFDITPACYITGIITERGIVYPDYQENLLQL